MPSGLEYNVDVALRLRQERSLAPSVWAGDPRLNARAKGHFSSAAILDFDQIWREASHPPELLACDFQVLSDYWSSEAFRSQRPQLMQELNRRSLPHTVRSIDKEVVLRGLLATATPLLLRSQADFLLASETPHNPINLSIFFLAKWLGIPTLFFQPTTAVAPALLPRTDLGEKYSLGRSDSDPANTFGSGKKMAALACSLDDMEKGVGTLRQRENVRVAEAHKARASTNKGRIFETLRLSYSGLRHISRPTATPAWLAGMQTYFKKELETSYEALQHTTASRTYALFALHYQPERTIVPESGYGVYSQQDLILKARKFVPEHIPLVVREHKSQSLPNKSGHFGRSALFYRWVQSLPNTQILSGEGPSGPLVERASAVFTSTGTIGIEASMKGVPAVHLGFPWWQGAPGTAPFSSLDSWDQVFSIPGAGGAEVRDFLSDLIAHQTIFGFGTPGQLDFWSSNPLEKKRSEADASEELVALTAKFAENLPK